MTATNTPTKRPTDRDRVAAVLRSIADAVHLAQTPTPHAVDLWRHDVPFRELMEYADRHGVEIKVLERTESHRAQASIHITIGAEILPTAYRVDLHLLSHDVADTHRAAYAEHNARQHGEMDD